MCGIAGMFDRSARTGDATLRLSAKAMGDALRHRGPDDEGVWADPAVGVALAFRRLAIRDLSPAGHQPMISASGRYVISYNGEIYSQDEIAKDLAARGVAFRGHSDTEVMLESFAAFGIAPTLERLIGMFAIALWDRETRTLTLVRDRLGIKPLYWAQFGELLLWGSELKALRAHTGWTPEIDRDAAASYVRHAYVPAPMGIYRGVHKLPPGCMLTLAPGEEPRVEPILERAPDCRDGRARTIRLFRRGSHRPSRGAAKRRRRPAVSIADVPLGAFLSGGINSSTVVALMQAQSTRPVRSLHDRLQRTGLRRGKPCQGGGRSSWHRPYRALCRARPCARDHPASGRHVRRALRRLVADSHLPGLGDDAPARHSGAVGRRRRRSVRRLQPLHPRQRYLERVAAHPSPLARAGRRRHSRRAARRLGTARWLCCRPRPAAGSRGAKLHKAAGMLGRPSTATRLYRAIVSHVGPARCPGAARP